MAAMAAVLLVSVVSRPLLADEPIGWALPPLLRGFDLVVGYQVSWILMFADYSRYTASERRAALGRLPRARAHQHLAS